jgi:hypothetical protein
MRSADANILLRIAQDDTWSFSLDSNTVFRVKKLDLPVASLHSPRTGQHNRPRLSPLSHLSMRHPTLDHNTCTESMLWGGALARVLCLVQQTR